MVLCSNTKYAVSSIVRDRVFKDQRGQTITGQPIYVLREVTLQDWIDDITANGPPPTATEIARAKMYAYYYEFHTD